jgi:hypothetical protein
LVAEVAGELPPDVARIVRQHVETCESCGARSRALVEPYELLAELGQQPVAYVPDLRQPVRLRLEQGRFSHALVRAAGVVGRGGLASIAALCGLALLIALVIATATFQAPLLLGRSTNGLAHVPAAGPGGVLYAATTKVLQIRVRSGQSWTVAEIVAVDEPTGRVVRSIPTDGFGLHIGSASELPAAVVLAPDGHTLYELSSPQAGAQVLLAFDARTGRLRFATPLALPGRGGLAPDSPALGLAVAPDGQRVYVSLGMGRDGPAGPRALVLDSAGARIAGTLVPDLDPVVPEPAMPAALPAVASPTPAPLLVTVGLRPALAAGGALVLSPDGYWLFDALALSNGQGNQAVVVRRFSAIDGTTAQALALPGDFTLAALAASPNPLQPLLYFVRGGSDAQAYVLRAMPAGPALVGQVPLGGPGAQTGVSFTGGIALSPTADGTQVYCSADLAASNGQSGSHDIWLVDGLSATVVAHRIGFLAAGQALANGAASDQEAVFVLLGGQIVLLPHDLALSAEPPAWLSLRDGTSVWRLVGTGR